MHQPTRMRARLIAPAVAGVLATGWLGASAAQPPHATTTTTTHVIAPSFPALAAPLAGEGGPPPGHRPKIAGEGGPPPGHLMV